MKDHADDIEHDIYESDGESYYPHTLYKWSDFTNYKLSMVHEFILLKQGCCTSL